MTKKELEMLEVLLKSKEDANKLSKLIKNYDSYILKFKKQAQPLLEKVNLEVKVGLAFIDKNK